MPTRSHKHTKYLPKLPPLCSPNNPLNPVTSDLSFHCPSLTSIQCAVIPINEAFVVSAVVDSAWRSGLRTGKRPRLDRTRTDQDRKIVRPVRTETAVRSSVLHNFKFQKTG